MTAVCLLVAAVTAAVCAYAWLPAAPGNTSAEAGFARDMQEHHAQGVEMSMIVRDRTSDEETRTLAFDIALTQQQQIGQMFDWLVQWRVPQARSGPAMAWMQGMAGHDMSATGGAATGPTVMPGMATAAQLTQLRQATGAEAEVLFLKLMIAHHRGGIEMADGILALTDEPVVVRFATTMRAAQQTEITAMNQMLQARGVDPV